MVIAGDGAGMVNIPELKGIHYAMHAGMYAAEAIVEALKQDSVNFEAYDERVRKSRDRQGPLPRRATCASRSRHGLLRRRRDRQRDDDHHGARSPAATGSSEPDAEDADGDRRRREELPEARRQVHFDKLSSVFASGNATRDDAPNHIRIQSHVPREVAQTWVSMCPAQVYEIPEEQLENGAAEVDVHVTAVELRPVRRDHRQGRPPDAARGRRRAALPGDLAQALPFGCESRLSSRGRRRGSTAAARWRDETARRLGAAIGPGLAAGERRVQALGEWSSSAAPGRRFSSSLSSPSAGLGAGWRSCQT